MTARGSGGLLAAAVGVLGVLVVAVAALAGESRPPEEPGALRERPNAGLREALCHGARVLAREGRCLTGGGAGVGLSERQFRDQAARLAELAREMAGEAKQLSAEPAQAARRVRQESAALAEVAREMLGKGGPLAEAARRLLTEAERLKSSAREAPTIQLEKPFTTLATGVSAI